MIMKRVFNVSFDTFKNSLTRLTNDYLNNSIYSYSLNLDQNKFFTSIIFKILGKQCRYFVEF